MTGSTGNAGAYARIIGNAGVYAGNTGNAGAYAGNTGNAGVYARNTVNAGVYAGSTGNAGAASAAKQAKPWASSRAPLEAHRSPQAEQTVSAQPDGLRAILWSACALRFTSNIAFEDANGIACFAALAAPVLPGNLHLPLKSSAWTSPLLPSSKPWPVWRA